MKLKGTKLHSFKKDFSRYLQKRYLLFLLRTIMKTKLLIFVLSICTITLHAQSEEDSADEELAKKPQNPIANMIIVPFQNNTSYGIGPDGRTANVLNVQPVIPIGLGEKINTLKLEVNKKEQ